MSFCFGCSKNCVPKSHCSNNCQLPDLFVEAWNLASSVIVKCCDTTNMNCDIKNLEVLNILDVENSS